MRWTLAAMVGAIAIAIAGPSLADTTPHRRHRQ